MSSDADLHGVSVAITGAADGIGCGLAHPTARYLATLAAGGPNGETWFDMERWPMWKEFDT